MQLYYPAHVRKYDNYVALYGFLRSISLLSNFIFIYLLIAELKTIKFDAEVDWAAIWALPVLFLATYLYYLGFIKFYRRYTLENFMCIVADERLSESSKLYLSTEKRQRN